MGDDFLAAAREYRSWDEARLERTLLELAAAKGYNLEVTEPQPGVHLAAFTKPDDVLDLGKVILASSEGTAATRRWRSSCS